MGLKSGKTTQTTTSSSAPTLPEYARPQYEQALKDIFAQYQDPNTTAQYQGSMVAPFSEQTQQALSRIQNRAMAGSPLQGAGSAEFLKTIQGDYLNPETNPYLQNTIDFANQNTIRNFQTSSIPALQATFAKGGRYGSGAIQGSFDDANRALMNQLSNNTNTLAAQNYGQERQNQLNAALQAPQYAQNDYNDLSKLFGVGQVQDTQNQNLINEQIQKFYAPQAAQQQSLNDFITRLQALAPLGQSGTNTQTNVQKSNGLSNALGIASLVAAPFTGGASLGASSLLGNMSGFQGGAGGFGGIPFGGFSGATGVPFKMF